MENVNWIKVNPTITEDEELCCNLQIKDNVSIILNNSEVKKLIKELIYYAIALEIKQQCSE